MASLGSIDALWASQALYPLMASLGFKAPYQVDQA